MSITTVLPYNYSQNTVNVITSSLFTYTNYVCHRPNCAVVFRGATGRQQKLPVHCTAHPLVFTVQVELIVVTTTTTCELY